VFIHGDSLERYCVGIVVPKPEEIIKIAKELGIAGTTDIEGLCKNTKINEFYLRNLLV